MSLFVNFGLKSLLKLLGDLFYICFDLFDGFLVDFFLLKMFQ